MERSNHIRSQALKWTALAFIFLFCYAAANKLLEFDTFRVQLGQSPLLAPYAHWVAIAVPFTEIAISLLLASPRLRHVGFLFSFGLMVMFTAYIIIILNYSAFVPCSCGGILSEMGWTEHLAFNSAFVLLALGAVVVDERAKITVGRRLLYSFAIALSGSATVIILFFLSEEEMHRNNGFLRRYPQHPVGDLKGIPLRYNSYYIAGFEKDRILLGNSTAPLHLLSVDTSLVKTKEIRIEIEDSKDYPFASVKVRVQPPDFYLGDGSIPIMYQGSTSNWKAKTLLREKNYFSLFEPLGNGNFAVRTNLQSNGQNVLAGITAGQKETMKIYGAALEAKVDGIFDTDGMLLYSQDLKKVIYVYYYRNSFVVAGDNFKSFYEGKTIDTITQVPMDFAYLKGNTEKKFARQPEKVNRYAATSGNYLFVKSDRLGRYETEEMSRQASIIDVYNLSKDSYEFSFYLYHYGGEEIQSFMVYGDILVGLTKKHLVATRLKKAYFNN